jgi:bifunctional N-acetylglucosamine-1-phosphate-uridyltransferase/glucosamine-1-phosphate-acetyltransferase GlmU-like protein
MSIGAVVLAAGQGTRMRSALPKVLHPLGGRPMLRWILDGLAEAGVARTMVVVGHGADLVRAALPDGVGSCVQERRLGTGHAAMVGLEALDPSCDTVLVLSGDVPLVDAALLRRLVDEHVAGDRAATVVTARPADAANPGPAGVPSPQLHRSAAGSLNVGDIGAA